MGILQRIAVVMLILTLTLLSNLTCLAQVSAQSYGNIQTDFLALVNAERTSLGKPSLAANLQLETAAYLHSKDMGDNVYFSHTSLDGREFSRRISDAGYRYVAAAENIAKAYGSPNASKVFDMWKNSPGHYANMIGNYVDAGLGVYSINGETYYTLDLGKCIASPTPTSKPVATATPTLSFPSSSPSSTPIIPETCLWVSMILLLIITLIIKLKNR